MIERDGVCLGLIRPSALGEKFVPEVDLLEDDIEYIESLGFMFEGGVWLRK